MRAEQEALDAIVADLSDERWACNAERRCGRWPPKIGHLTYFDGARHGHQRPGVSRSVGQLWLPTTGTR